MPLDSLILILLTKELLAGQLDLTTACLKVEQHWSQLEDHEKGAKEPLMAT